jgi:glycosyltransferase involved in cell wall biosynthesis
MITLAAPSDASSLPEATAAQRTVPTAPRVAIVHDWFQGFHGAERVVEAMRSDVFGDTRADIFTFHAAHELLPPALDQAIVRESRASRLPGIRQRGHDPGRWRYLLPYMPRYFRSLDLDSYDVVVSSSHAFAVQARARADALTVCYCYTPIRYAWLPETDADRAPGIGGWALARFGSHLRRLDFEASQRVDRYVAISSVVQERIRRFYGRDSEVIYPPVDVADLDPTREKEPGSFLWVHRLVPYKRPEYVMEAFRGLPYRLTMVGVGPLEETLRRNLPPNVELRGWVSRDELTDLYATASGFIHVGEEDFGITMVEALAAGVPVLALDRGGARDIVRDGTDGALVGSASVEAIRRGVQVLAGRDWDREALRARATSFSREVFVDRFRALLESLRLQTR